MKFNQIVFCFIFILTGCFSKRQQTVWKNSSGESTELQVVSEEKKAIVPGIPAIDSSVITYSRNARPILAIKFGSPVIVTKANEPQEWGNYQFPTIAYDTRNAKELVVKTHMSPDAVASYGKTNYIYSFSKDSGKTWRSEKSSDPAMENQVAEGLLLPNGDRLKVITPPSINEKNLKLPAPVTVNGDMKFYKLSDLPEQRQGVFLARMKKGNTKWVNEKGRLIDSLALRYSLKGEMPVVWWGDMKLMADGSLIAGIYPGFNLDDIHKEKIKSGVFFYKSTDNGHTWKIQGRIPFHNDPVLQPVVEGWGFTEPAFEILKDGTFLAVIRTTDNQNGPMYASRSTDQGKTWSVPKVIAPAGVLPRLLQLENGVIVLSSGRPGVQLRFSKDGETWTTPFEMLHYTPINVVDWFTSCGYTNLLAAGPDSFQIVYSDFFTMNEKGQMRKSIKFRKITVKNLP